MTMQQDSSHPTGVSDDSPRGGSEVARARKRKSKSAIQLRSEGKTWAEIAMILGYPTPRAALVATEVALSAQLDDEGQAFMRRLASERYDRLLRALWKKATDTSSPEQMQAVDRVRAIMKDHQNLHGYSVPKTSVVVTPTMAKLEAWVGQIIQMQTVELDESDILTLEPIEDEEPGP